MYLSIFSEDLQDKIGVVDVFSSLIWVRRYDKSGSIELKAPANKNNLALLQKRRFIKKENDDEIAYITDLNIIKNADGVEEINVVGWLYEGILSLRVVLNDADNLGALISNNLRGINLNIADRVFNVSFETTAVDDNGDTIQLTDDFVGQNLLDVISAVAKSQGFGFRVFLATNGPTFTIYYGADLSTMQEENPRCIFSDNFENLKSAEYIDSDIGVINTVYCRCKIPAGTEPCSNPPTYEISPQNENEQRFEKFLWVDAETYDERVVVEGENGSTTITKTYVDRTKTLQKMKTEAQKSLVPVAENFTGTVDFKLKYRTEYDVGDIVTIKHIGWSKTAHPQITEVVEYFDHTENAVIPTFGEPRKTILDILKKG